MNATFRFALVAAVTASSFGWALPAHAACPAGSILVPKWGCVNGPQLKDIQIQDRMEGQFDPSEDSTKSFALHGLDPAASYGILDQDTGEKSTQTGGELMRNFPITIPQKHESKMFIYRRQS